MKKLIAPVFVIVASVILLIVNVVSSAEYDKGFWFRCVSSILLIAGMVFTIIANKKQVEEKDE